MSSEHGFDPLNPPQLPREARAVGGCTCGGLHLHTEVCSIWTMDREAAHQAIADAEARVTAHTEELNMRLRSWLEVHDA